MNTISIWLYVVTVTVTGIACYVGGYIEGRYVGIATGRSRDNRDE